MGKEVIMGIARHSFHAACAALLLVVLLPAFGCSDGGDMYVAGGSTGGLGGVFGMMAVDDSGFSR